MISLVAMPAAQGSLTSWLAIGVGAFVVGWVFQAIGHVFEGRKPAFFDDLRGLLVGPLFLVAEIAFAAGLAATLRGEVEAQARIH